MGGMNGEGIFTLCDYFGDNIRWHTQNIDTDPWEWRSRILSEHNDIVYSKLFFKKCGYITMEWYPYLYVIRRGEKTFQDEYKNGNLSYVEKKIYNYLTDNEGAPLHIIKQNCVYSSEDSYRFQNAIINLQMKMYITTSGQARKTTKCGNEYGWHSMSYCTVDSLFRDLKEKTVGLKMKDAYAAVENHVYSINPLANPVKVKKFILG